MAQFDDAKVGVRLWDYNFGWGNIIAIRDDGYRRPIRVKFDFVEYATEMDEYCQDYSLDGKYLESINPTLFWDEVKIVPPERPKEIHVCDWEYMQSTTHYWERCSVCQACRKYGELPKETCEACELIKKNGDLFAYSTIRRTLLFLLNQFHTCEKGKR